MTTQTHAGVALLHTLQLIKDRYGMDVDPDYRLHFHGPRHTSGVVRRAKALAHAMDLEPEITALVIIAAAFHDTVQNWEESTTADGRCMRRRFAGDNERASALEAIAWMKKNGVFADIEYRLVTTAIMATVPGWDADAGTVLQPNLNSESSLVAWAVALADLGAAGMDGARFICEGDALFLEENLDIARSIRTAQSRSDIDTSTQERYLQRMLSWSTSQPGFARGRARRLETELSMLPESVRERVRALFSKFEEAAAAAETLSMERIHLSFWEVAEAMGYIIPMA